MTPTESNQPSSPAKDRTTTQSAQSDRQVKLRRQKNGQYTGSLLG